MQSSGKFDEKEIEEKEVSEATEIEKKRGGKVSKND